MYVCVCVCVCIVAHISYLVQCVCFCVCVRSCVFECAKLSVSLFMRVYAWVCECVCVCVCFLHNLAWGCVTAPTTEAEVCTWAAVSTHRALHTGRNMDRHVFVYFCFASQNKHKQTNTLCLKKTIKITLIRAFKSNSMMNWYPFEITWSMSQGQLPSCLRASSMKQWTLVVH